MAKKKTASRGDQPVALTTKKPVAAWTVELNVSPQVRRWLLKRIGWSVGDQLTKDQFLSLISAAEGIA